MTQEVIITLDIDLNQENGKRTLRAMERHLVEHGFTNHQSSIDEDWGCVSYKTAKSLTDVRGIQNHLLNQAQSSNIRVTSEIREFTPMITFNLKDVNLGDSSVNDFVSNLGKVNIVGDVGEISFTSTASRDQALASLNEKGLAADSYFNEEIIESTNNFTIKTKKNAFR